MNKYVSALEHAEFKIRVGKVTHFVGLVIEASGPNVFLGELCEVYAANSIKPVLAEVVGFKDGRILLMPYGKVKGISLGSDVIATGHVARVVVGEQLLGRVVDAFVEPLDDKGPIANTEYYPLYRDAHNPMEREPIGERLASGVKAIDAFLTMGKGQRVGVFAGSGVGKSSLLGMLTRNSSADVNVIALIGERGREVMDFIEESLGDEGLKKSVVIVATADQTALTRAHAVHAAMTVAEYFCDQGKEVLLTLDSITRFAMAQREIGLAVGEPPTARGYTPSVFSLLPAIVERGGNFKGKGSISAIYTVLVEGDDLNEPITDNMRAILDGHIVLSREMANRGDFPAIDITKSISRLFNRLVNKEEKDVANKLRSAIAQYESTLDLIEIGAYEKGKNQQLDNIIAVYPAIAGILKQDLAETFTRTTTMAQVKSVANRL